MKKRRHHQQKCSAFSFHFHSKNLIDDNQNQSLRLLTNTALVALITNHPLIMKKVLLYLPGNHSTLTDMEKKSFLFNSFPKTWILEFRLNGNDPELASEKMKYSMEKKKEMANREENNKERAKAKKLEDSNKKREEKKRNQPCRTHSGLK